LEKGIEGQKAVNATLKNKNQKPLTQQTLKPLSKKFKNPKNKKWPQSNLKSSGRN